MAAPAGPPIQIALATYQSAPFLPALLESLFAQSEQRFTLLVADDGSRDGTIAILEDYAARYPGRIVIVARERQELGALGNFARLVDCAAAEYLMLCDHDDVWLPDKIARSLARMRELEAQQGVGTPLLVHTDLAVVDAQLETISPSLFKYSNGDPSRNDFISLLSANVASGCTIVVNRALYQKARPIPAEAVMHDHWLTLVASLLGGISCIDEPTILYRQHGGNVIGARSAGTASLVERVRQTLFSDNRQRIMQRYSRQAAALLQRFGHEMAPPARRATETLAQLWVMSRWRRFGRMRRNGLGFSGFVRNAALFMVVMRDPPEGGGA